MGRHFTHSAKCLKLNKKPFEPMFRQVLHTPHLHIFTAPTGGEKLSSMKSAFLIGQTDCVYVPPTMREMAPCVSDSDWSARMLCVCPTNAGWKHQLLIGRRHEKERTPTSDCQVVFIGVSPTKNDNFYLVIGLFKRSCCFNLTSYYYDSFMI